jgi:hypothetical protein
MKASKPSVNQFVIAAIVAAPVPLSGQRQPPTLALVRLLASLAVPLAIEERETRRSPAIAEGT